jgi:hypothetical protein
VLLAVSELCRLGRNQVNPKPGWCRNGHRYTEANTLWTTEKRWSKKDGDTRDYKCRKCRRCFNVRKKLEARKRRALAKAQSASLVLQSRQSQVGARVHDSVALDCAKGMLDRLKRDLSLSEPSSTSTR